MQEVRQQNMQADTYISYAMAFGGYADVYTITVQGEAEPLPEGMLWVCQ